jgi:hypothetical protein
MSNMNKMNAEIKKVVGRVKAAQAQLQTLLKDKTWIDEAKKYADRQGKEVKKLLAGDVSKVKTFIERERKELERFQKQIPGEVQKLRKFVDGQRKELEKLLKNVRKVKASGPKAGKASNGAGKAKKSGAKKSESSASPSAQA